MRRLDRMLRCGTTTVEVKSGSLRPCACTQLSPTLFLLTSLCRHRGVNTPGYGLDVESEMKMLKVRACSPARSHPCVNDDLVLSVHPPSCITVFANLFLSLARTTVCGLAPSR